MRSKKFAKEWDSLKKNLQIYIQSKSRLNVIFDVLVSAFFFLTIFSIPTFSSVFPKSLLVWFFSICLFLLIGLSLILYSGIRIDIVSISFALFALLALISTLLMGFKSTNITPIFMVFISLIVYTYYKNNPSLIKSGIICVQLAVILFMIIYFAYYKSSVFKLGDERLGGHFGDENDICFIFSLGIAFSLYYLIFNHNWILKIIWLVLGILIFICGLSGGSKMFFISTILVFIVMIVIKNGKNHWWVTLIMMGALACGVILLFTLPQLSSFKDRLLGMLNVFGYSDKVKQDNSTVERLQMFSIGLEMFFKRPILGYGMNGFALFANFNGGWSHNHISETLCNYGVLGTITWHIGFGASLYVLIRKILSKDTRSFDYLIFGVLILFISVFLSIPQQNQKMCAFVMPLVYAWCTKDFLSYDLSKLKIIQILRSKKCENC